MTLLMARATLRRGNVRAKGSKRERKKEGKESDTRWQKGGRS